MFSRVRVSKNHDLITLSREGERTVEGDKVLILRPLTLALSPSGGEGNEFLDGH